MYPILFVIARRISFLPFSMEICLLQPMRLSLLQPMRLSLCLFPLCYLITLYKKGEDSFICKQSKQCLASLFVQMPLAGKTFSDFVKYMNKVEEVKHVVQVKVLSNKSQNMGNFW